MPDGIAAGERLDQWKGIAEYLGRDVSTVIRWSKENGLPVHRVPGRQRRRPVFAYRSEIDAWMASSAFLGKTSAEGPQPHLDSAPSSANPLPETEPQAATAALVPEAPREGRREAFRSRFVFWTLAVLVVGALAVFAVQRQLSPRTVQSGGETLIASLDAPIEGNLVVGDGKLYFGAWQGGRLSLFSIPESGGALQEIPVPFAQTEPLAISKNGKRLLVRAWSGHEVERQLWWVPLRGGTPSRVGQILCHAASLSPDGHTLAYAFGHSLYLTADNGATSHLLQSFTQLPYHIRWSLDGQRILILLSYSDEKTAIWKIVTARRDPLILTALEPITRVSRGDDSIAPLNRKDDLFLANGSGDPAIYFLRNSRLPWFPSLKAQVFAETPHGANDLSVDRTRRELFYTRDTTERDELNLFDPRSGSIRPFQPGLSAQDIDFSRDGSRMAYVTNAGTTTSKLWVSRSDGSHAQSISSAGTEYIELPRWSPDGKQLAFMARRVGQPYRIFLVSPSGGQPREASHSADNQGAPTWTPDGRTLVYGRVLCHEDNSCAIYRIDLATGGVDMIPGSDGLSTARVSPDGRYIAALRSNASQILLLDRRTGKWRKLADGVTGDDLAWSPDSHFVYASRPVGDTPAILRVSLSGEVSVALDLSPWSKLCGRVDTWFTPAPDGSLIFVRFITGSEIVALHYDLR